MTDDGRGWVALARLRRPRGRRGELAADSLGSPPQRFRELERVWLFAAESGRSGVFPIEDVWEHQGSLILKFRGIDSIAEAGAWRGAEVRIPAGERKPAAPGEYYLSDLTGCRVLDRHTGLPIGRVRGWQEAAGAVLLEVEGEDGAEVLIPFARLICTEIDPAAKTIRVAMPEGLLELNRR